MVAHADELDLSGLRLSGGEGRQLALAVRIEPLQMASERYEALPRRVPVQLDVSRMLGGGYALRLRFEAALSGPCMRCLGDAGPIVQVDAREVSRPGEGEELESPYVTDKKLDLAGWARDAFLLAAPVKVLCREDCAGLCPVCAVDLNQAGGDHRHASPPDRRLAKLRELKLQ